MSGHAPVTRRQFLATGAAGAAALASSNEAVAQAQKLHVKPLPSEIFISHGINLETRLETLRGYVTPASHFFIRQHATTPALDTRTWAWARWDFEWDARPGEHVIMTRAIDDQGNTQPASIPWNAQGYGYNVPVPHPVTVTA